MRLAILMARRGLGRVWPNPCVGCVIVDSSGYVVARGWTQDGGRPHAETVALQTAGENARGGTAFVSLEPCAHHGQTGPCVQALIGAGISRVVSAFEDPDPRVSGRGHAMLRNAGIEVRTGVLELQARAQNAGFLSRVERGRPLVTLKIASTLDGKTALESGESQWITGPQAREHVHLMRAQHDAVMTGIGTVLADDPDLSCRLRGIDHSRAVRIVVDTQGRLPGNSKLALSVARQPVWCLTSPAAATKGIAVSGVRTFELPEGSGGVDLEQGLRLLAAQGLTRIFVEAGARLAASLLRSNLVDQLLWYRAATVMGPGISAVSNLGNLRLAELPRFRLLETIRLGSDLLETYRTGA